MDYQNSRNQQDSTQNPYYNQPTHNPYRQNAFASAALVCGIFSVLSICTGVFSLIFGALGILFAVLAHRRGKRLPSSAAAGAALSGVGLVISVMIVVYAFISLPTLLKDEAFRKQIDAVSEQMYGQSFTELLENYYGVTIEE